MKAKQLTNIRAAGFDANIILTPPIRLNLEQALEFIDDDELVDTPKAVQLRKKLLNEHQRKRARRCRRVIGPLQQRGPWSPLPERRRE